MRKDLVQPQPDKTISPPKGLHVLAALGLVGTVLAGCAPDAGRQTYSLQSGQALVPASTVMVAAPKAVQNSAPVGSALGVGPMKTVAKAPVTAPVKATAKTPVPIPENVPLSKPATPAPEPTITSESGNLRGPLDASMRGKVEEVEKEDETPLAVTLYD